jgi:predicted DNA-binding protein with PD1-like motif
MRMIVTRLRPGHDLKHSIESIVRVMDIRAAVIISGVGGLVSATLRAASLENEEPNIITLRGPLAIVSLTGTLGPERVHIHIAVADKDGNVIGGHVKKGCIVDTTVELALAVEDKLTFGKEWICLEHKLIAV